MNIDLSYGEEKMDEKRFGIKDDGWDIEDFENIGLMQFFRDVDILSYEIKNCSRGRYADIGTQTAGVVDYLEGLKEQLNSAIELINHQLSNEEGR